MRYCVLIILLLALVLPIGSGQALAQGQPGISVDVQVGYDGAYRLGEWFPVAVTIANDGPDISGVLEWRFSARPDEATFQRTVELPRGSRKRVTMDVFARDLVRNGQLRLLNGSTVMLERTVQLDAIDQGRFVIGVVSGDTGLLNSLNSLILPDVGSAVVRHIDVSMFPESTATLRGLNALFLHDVDTASFSQAQRDAIAQWVQIGGQLIVGGGASGPRTAAGIAGLLPVDVGTEVTQGDLTPLGELAGQAPPAGAATLSVAQPRSGAEALPEQSPRLFRWRYGSGIITFTTFDLSSLRSWDSEQQLWARLLSSNSMNIPGANLRPNQSNLLQASLRLSSLGLPSIYMLLLFMIGYTVIIGPLNYLLLRRFQRLDWAWLTVPLTVVVFAGGLYVVGFGLRGGQAQVEQVAVVYGAEGMPRGVLASFVGLFSPRRTSYDLSFPADLLVSEPQAFSGLPYGDALIRQTDSGAELPEVLVDVGAVRTFMVEGTAEIPFNIISSLSFGNNSVSGTIQNNGAQPLEDVMIVRGSAFQSLGGLAPGAQATLSLDSSSSFPWISNLPRMGNFDRQQILSALFESNITNFGSSSPPLNGQSIYLLIWSKSPSVAVRVNNLQASQDALTLYVLRLNDGSRLPVPLSLPPTPEPSPATDASGAPIQPTPAPVATPTPAPSPATEATEATMPPTPEPSPATDASGATTEAPIPPTPTPAPSPATEATMPPTPAPTATPTS